MSVRRKKGFTLIELIAVLVIMAILALIVTPLVLNIIRKAKIAADKRSIDAYGRSVELAIAGYLMDNGTFPTSIGQLTIEYSGDEVVCSTTQLNGDSSVYLTGCTVGGRNVDYSYGTDKTPPAPTYTAYSVGDEVSYNNVDYYVIADSGINESTVTLLKAEPLTVDEVNTYGEGHVNRYTSDSVGPARDFNNSGYGAMQYYSSEMCRYNFNSDNAINAGCTTDYGESEVKYVVDAWKAAKAPASLEARLITIDELKNNLGYNYAEDNVSYFNLNAEYTPSWVNSSNYQYWTSSQFEDYEYRVWYVSNSGLDFQSVYHDNLGVVRPVITILKTSLSS